MLRVYTPQRVVQMIGDSISFLGEEVIEEHTGRLGLSVNHEISAFAELSDLRADCLTGLAISAKGDREVFEAVSLGFIEISPEQLRVVRTEVEKARKLLEEHGKLSAWNRFKNRDAANQQEQILRAHEHYTFDYSLTQLGRAAVLPIDREIVALAEFTQILVGLQ
ncbi:hypothetical protein FJZ17_04600 [Candidatus Pacearchaeota archaeon]|nr:hypothetical protein [Candidatus Pacearchaeota archaeon]